MTLVVGPATALCMGTILLVIADNGGADPVTGPPVIRRFLVVFLVCWALLWCLPWWRGLRRVRLVLAAITVAVLTVLPFALLTVNANALIPDRFRYPGGPLQIIPLLVPVLPLCIPIRDRRLRTAYLVGYLVVLVGAWINVDAGYLSTELTTVVALCGLAAVVRLAVSWIGPDGAEPYDADS